jgi:hypothetical protein
MKNLPLKETLTEENLKNAYENFFAYRNDNINYDKRYSSWDLCYNHFNNKQSPDKTSGLNLAFYLASWGMFRGSSGLLNLGKNKYDDLANLLFENKGKEFINQYNEIEKFLKENEISPTKTLITKIMLGVYANTPAIDRFFNKTAIKYCIGIYDNDSVENLLKKLQRIFETKIDNGQNLEKFIDRLPKNGLTKEKIIDGIFFQIGKTI